MRQSRSVAGTAILLLSFSAILIMTWAPPAFAACTFDKSNEHTVGSVFHGWSRTFCEQSGTYTFSGETNHSHGSKYVAVVDNTGYIFRCDDLESGSVNAFCSKSGLTVNNMSYHDIAGGGCFNRFGDGHGFDCHFMETLP